MISFTERQLSDGLVYFREILPRAREQLSATATLSRSGLAEAVVPYLTEDNIKAVVVHQTTQGGWLADVVLIDTPIGVSNVLGTPVQYPHSTRQEAENAAVGLLACCLRIGMEKPVEVKKPVFFYYDAEITLTETVLAILKKVGARFPSDPFAIVRLQEITDKCFPEGYSFERFDAIDETRRTELLAVIHMAVMHGILRFPEPVAGGCPSEKTIFV